MKNIEEQNKEDFEELPFGIDDDSDSLLGESGLLDDMLEGIADTIIQSFASVYREAGSDLRDKILTRLNYQTDCIKSGGKSNKCYELVSNLEGSLELCCNGVEVIASEDYPESFDIVFYKDCFNVVNRLNNTCEMIPYENVRAIDLIMYEAPSLTSIISSADRLRLLASMYYITYRIEKKKNLRNADKNRIDEYSENTVYFDSIHNAVKCNNYVLGTCENLGYKYAIIDITRNYVDAINWSETIVSATTRLTEIKGFDGERKIATGELTVRYNVNDVSSKGLTLTLEYRDAANTVIFIRNIDSVPVKVKLLENASVKSYQLPPNSEICCCSLQD